MNFSSALINRFSIWILHTNTFEGEEILGIDRSTYQIGIFN